MKLRVFVVTVALLGVGCPGPMKPPSNATRVVVTTVDPTPPPPTSRGLEPAQPTLRLPRNFVPTAYEAHLDIDPARAGFTGTIAITGTISERSSVIWLHGRKLAVTRAVASQGDPFGTRKASDAQLVVTPRGDDLLEIRAVQPLDAGRWTLTLDYAGEFDLLSTAGAFKQLVGPDAYVYTQLEALYARRVFPCFDEPDNKVPWKLVLDVPKHLVAVANTPIVKEAPFGEDGLRKRVEFAPTRPLPSYLVAFGVGPFELVDAGKSKAGTPIRIVALKGRGADSAWAAKTTAPILDHLEDWFGTPYPYEKLDMLAIPVTVGFGAMENAGLITFAERFIHIDPQRGSKERQRTWVVIASHELAHQWFGNLVTMRWWDDLWLNEGFANWMEHKISAKLDPSWHDELSDVDTRHEALDADALVTARRIRQPIEAVDDILTAFDRITYDKGASVLNMFETYVGAPVFQQGVRAYLQAHQYGSATSADFVSAISKVAGKDLGPAFATFLDQPGAPELTASVVCDRGKPPKITLAQRRYLPPGAAAATDGKPWLLPVCVAFEQGGKRAETCTLLAQPTGVLELATKTCPRWMVPNVNARGYYRATFTASQLTALRDEAWPLMPWSERRGTFFDARSSATLGKLPLALALSFVPKMLAGADRFTVDDAVELPESFERFVPEVLRPKYEQWLRATFGPGAEQVGLVPKDTDTLDTERSRSALVASVAWLGREPVLVDAATKLAQAGWRDLPQSVRGLVLELAVDASPAVFDQVRVEVFAEPDRTRRGEMLTALAHVRDPRRQLVALALVNDPKLDLRETVAMLFDTSTDANRTVAAQFFKDHKDRILARLPKDETTGPFAGRFAGLYTSACDAAQRDAVAAYVTATFAPMSGGARAVRQEIEQMDQCIAGRKLLQPELLGWLSGVKIPKPPKARTSR
ncbi:MAG: M1 family metallopeptidase [Deltaproteobacteria bacterium]|nr:M1 family metallopeptidase [Deltaproteobacteria bacterium]